MAEAAKKKLAWRPWLRAIHRDAGYIVVGLTHRDGVNVSRSSVIEARDVLPQTRPSFIHAPQHLG